MSGQNPPPTWPRGGPTGPPPSGPPPSGPPPSGPPPSGPPPGKGWPQAQSATAATAVRRTAVPRRAATGPAAGPPTPPLAGHPGRRARGAAGVRSLRHRVGILHRTLRDRPTERQGQGGGERDRRRRRGPGVGGRRRPRVRGRRARARDPVRGAREARPDRRRRRRLDLHGRMAVPRRDDVRRGAAGLLRRLGRASRGRVGAREHRLPGRHRCLDDGRVLRRGDAHALRGSGGRRRGPRRRGECPRRVLRGGPARTQRARPGRRTGRWSSRSTTSVQRQAPPRSRSGTTAPGSPSTAARMPSTPTPVAARGASMPGSRRPSRGARRAPPTSASVAARSRPGSGGCGPRSCTYTAGCTTWDLRYEGFASFDSENVRLFENGGDCNSESGQCEHTFLTSATGRGVAVSWSVYPGYSERFEARIRKMTAQLPASAPRPRSCALRAPMARTSLRWRRSTCAQHASAPPPCHAHTLNTPTT